MIEAGYSVSGWAHGFPPLGVAACRQLVEVHRTSASCVLTVSVCLRRIYWQLWKDSG